MQEALHGVDGVPDPERRRRPLPGRGSEDGDGEDNEGEVPDDIEEDDGAGVGPVGLPLLQLEGGRLPDEHRRLPEDPAACGPADEGGDVDAEASGGALEERCGVHQSMATWIFFFLHSFLFRELLEREKALERERVWNVFGGERVTERKGSGQIGVCVRERR